MILRENKHPFNQTMSEYGPTLKRHKNREITLYYPSIKLPLQFQEFANEIKLITITLQMNLLDYKLYLSSKLTKP